MKSKTLDFIVVMTIRRNLRNAYNDAIAKGLQAQMANEEMRDRRDEDDLLARDWSGLIADRIVYFNKTINEAKRAFLDLTSGRTNPSLNNIEAVCTALKRYHNYFVKDIDFKICDDETIIVDLSQLRLYPIYGEFAFLTIDTSKKLSKYNHEEQKLLKHIYGPTTEDYHAKMKMLNKSGRNQTMICVLAPEYIRAQFGPVSRASWFNNFSNEFRLLCL